MRALGSARGRRASLFFRVPSTGTPLSVVNPFRGGVLIFRIIQAPRPAEGPTTGGSGLATTQRIVKRHDQDNPSKKSGP